MDYFKSSNVKTKIDTSINIFVVYADEDRTYFRELQTNLSPLERNHTIKIRSADNFLSDRSMQQLYDEALHNADLILCLISADFFVSDEHYEILEKALQHHQKGEAMLIPIILRACDWKRFPFDQLQVLPKMKPPLGNG
ncbi:MAG: toll/interleukin-1 receptor domain-containing protein [Sphingobacteriales bacterium]|nr:toll/interleukin-1 receptor domain-containing protein [Sphingobacteriales bacterium]